MKTKSDFWHASSLCQVGHSHKSELGVAKICRIKRIFKIQYYVKFLRKNVHHSNFPLKSLHKLSTPFLKDKNQNILVKFEKWFNFGMFFLHFLLGVMKIIGPFFTSSPFWVCSLVKKMDALNKKSCFTPW